MLAKLVTAACIVGAAAVTGGSARLLLSRA
jgi:hypothetical protein